MPIIVLIMKRRPVAQGIMNCLQDYKNIRLVYEPYYHRGHITIKNNKARVALIEVAESGPYDIGYCLELCKKLREETPDCTLILMCSEQDEKTIKKVVEAKGQNRIDDFVFFDVTIDYLTSKLMSI